MNNLIHSDEKFLDHFKSFWVFVNVGFAEGMEEVSVDVQKLWEALLGAALSAHMKVLRRASIPVALSKCVSTYLGFAMEHQQSAPVLRAVCDLLDGTFG